MKVCLQVLRRIDNRPNPLPSGNAAWLVAFCQNKAI